MEELKRVVNKKQVASTLFWVIILFGAVGGYLVCRNEVKEAFGYLRDANLAVLLMLVPIIFAMYWAAGQIWYPYLKHDGLSASQLASIQYELNFVNTVVPFLSISGWVYAVARLKKLNVSDGRISGMYFFRYIISISTKWLEIAAIMCALPLINADAGVPMFFAGFAGMPIIISRIIIALAMIIILGFILGLICLPQRLRVPTILLNNSSSWGKKNAETSRDTGQSMPDFEVGPLPEDGISECLYLGADLLCPRGNAVRRRGNSDGTSGVSNAGSSGLRHSNYRGCAHSDSNGDRWF